MNANKITSKGASSLFDTLCECNSKVEFINISCNQLNQDIEKSMNKYIEASQYIESITTGHVKSLSPGMNQCKLKYFTKKPASEQFLQNQSSNVSASDVSDDSSTCIVIIDRSYDGSVRIVRDVGGNNSDDVQKRIKKMLREEERKHGFPHPHYDALLPRISYQNIKAPVWSLIVYSINDTKREYLPLEKPVELSSEKDLIIFKEDPFNHMIMDYQGDGYCQIHVYCRKGKRKDNELTRREGFKILLGKLFVDKVSAKLYANAVDQLNFWKDVDVIEEYSKQADFNDRSLLV